MDKIKMIINACQVGEYEIVDNEMRFKVSDSDCEHYFEEFKIEQRKIDNVTYNIINLDVI